MTVGGADLSAGRIFEGHLNAVKLAGASHIRFARMTVPAELPAGRFDLIV